MEIQGKTDSIPVWLCLFTNDEFPELCPVRALLWYMKIFNIKDGYLFPEDDVLLLQHSKGSSEPLAAEKQIEHGHFLVIVGNLIETVCKRDMKQFTVDTNIFCKTAYLVALWGFFAGLGQGGKCIHEVQIPQMYLVNIMKSARDKSVRNANIYQKDAAKLYEYAMREEDPGNNRVGRFMSIFLQPHTHGSAATSSTPYQKDLPDLVEWWFVKCLGLDPMVSLNPVQLFHLVCSQRTPAKGLDALKQVLLEKISDAGMVDSLLAQINDLVHERSRQRIQLLQQHHEDIKSIVVTHGSTSTVSQLSTDMNGSANVQDLPSESAKIVLPRTGFAKAKGRDKISQLLACRDHIANNAGGDVSCLQRLCRKWYMKNLSILVCYEDHMHCSMTGFLSLYGNQFKTSKWKCKCRDGVMPLGRMDM
jgi:hypothetical protein